MDETLQLSGGFFNLYCLHIVTERELGLHKGAGDYFHRKGEYKRGLDVFWLSGGEGKEHFEKERKINQRRREAFSPPLGRIHSNKEGKLVVTPFEHLVCDPHQAILVRA